MPFDYVERKVDVGLFGGQSWAQVRAGRIILVAATNYWVMFALLSLVAAGGAYAIHARMGSQGIALVIAAALVSAAMAARSIYLGMGIKRFGRVHAYIDDKRIAVGCERDMLGIPWKVVGQVQRVYDENDPNALPNLSPDWKFMVIPLQADALDEITIMDVQTHEQVPWDRTGYRRFTLSVRYDPERTRLEIHSTCTHFIKELTTVLYPMMAAGRSE